MERLSLSKREWQDIVDQWQKSGQSMSGFCKKKGISKSSLGYRAVKFRKAKDSVSSNFVKLSFPKEKTLEAKNCEILFPNGIRILFYEKPDCLQLKQLFS